MESPSKMLLSLELVRGIYEYGLGWLFHNHLTLSSPHGDGHSVMVIPGLCGSDESTHYMRGFLSELGYDSHSWGLGRNLGPRHGMDKLLSQLMDRVSDVAASSPDGQISLIGWSLGGIYAREIAKACPGVVRQVITLGTPFKAAGVGTNVSRVYEMLSKDKSHKDPEIIKRLEVAPPVPFTSIYSKSDGVVHWESSIENETPISQNIEISFASHVGLGHHPAAMAIIADRLKQTKETWQRYNT